MMLTTRGRYGVMAMADLAVQSQEKPVNLKQIAERQKIELKYLEQIFMQLRKSNLVRSLKGPGGGYLLNLPAENILIGDIVAAVEESIRMTRCSDPLKGCLEGTKCLTHELWAGLGKVIENYLSSVTLHDVCNNRLQR